jgi:hypothetical protein
MRMRLAHHGRINVVIDPLTPNILARIPYPCLLHNCVTTSRYGHISHNLASTNIPQFSRERGGRNCSKLLFNFGSSSIRCTQARQPPNTYAFSLFIGLSLVGSALQPAVHLPELQLSMHQATYTISLCAVPPNGSQREACQAAVCRRASDNGGV